METSPLICTAYQWDGFCIIATLNWNGLNHAERQNEKYYQNVYFQIQQDDVVSPAAISEFHSIRVNSRLNTGWKWNQCYCSEKLTIYCCTKPA